MKRFKKLIIATIIILAFIKIFSNMVSYGIIFHPTGKLENIKTQYPSGVYKYGITYTDIWSWNNINCVRRGRMAW